MNPASKEVDKIEFRFSLSNNIPVSRTEDTDDIKFKVEKIASKDVLSEIKITTSFKVVEEGLANATEKAMLLCNYLNFK
jgi:hypothetical protein